MKFRRLIGILLVLAMLCTAAGCGKSSELENMMAIGNPVQQQESGAVSGLPEGTACLELVDAKKSRGRYYIECLLLDADAQLLSDETYRIPLAEDVSFSFYPMNTPGSGGEDFYSAEHFYDSYDEEQMKGLWFWTYEFDGSGALTYLSDEVPWELRTEEHPVEDFYGCWDYSECFWQPGLDMYNVPGAPPCGDYIVIHKDGTAEVYKLEENTVYHASWVLWDRSVYIEALEIFLTFVDGNLEDSNGHWAQQGPEPSSDGMDWVDLT